MVPEVALVIALTAWKDAIFWSRSSQTVQTWVSAAAIMAVSSPAFYLCLYYVSFSAGPDRSGKFSPHKVPLSADTKADLEARSGTCICRRES